MRIVSDVPLVISGKMYSGTSACGEVYIDDVWSIPFEQITLPDWIWAPSGRNHTFRIQIGRSFLKDVAIRNNIQ